MARRARLAATLVFFVTGWLSAAWATRIPAVRAELDLSTGELAVAVLGLEAGAIAGLPAGGAVTARLGSPRALRIGFGVLATSLFGVALAPGLGALVAALAVTAAGTSVVDVAMNAQGVELDRRYRRPVLSSLHAAHPLGLAVGGLAGMAAAGSGLSLAAHFAAVASLGLVAAMTATVFLVREPAGDTRGAIERPSGRVMLLGLIAFCAFLLDGAASNWSAVHLESDHGAGAVVAAAAFTLFSLTLAAGRLAGDRLVARVGRARVVQASGAIAAAGSALAVAAPSVEAALAGWAVFGLGLATLAPTVLGAAPGAGRASPAAAIAAVTTVGYLGSFSGPPAIGALAELTGLSAALGMLVAMSLLTAVLANPALRRCA